MTQDEIIEMAMQTEFILHGKPSDEESELFVCVNKDIVRFAKLVAAKAIAELESQEPVAWMDGDGNLFPFVWNVGVQQGSKYLDETLTPLYTHPPRRTWVGLTNADKYEFAAAQCSWEELLIAAEAKLKQKNT
jgi:hypothetical protein